MSKTPRPPLLPLRFFRWFCHPDYVEDIEGDLLERFQKRVEENGSSKAKWSFIKEVMLVMRPGIVGFRSKEMNGITMMGHYLKVTKRNLLKQKIHSAINISGLIIGLSTSLILFKYVGFEWTQDDFHVNRERIYQITHEERNAISSSAENTTYWGIGEQVIKNYPGVVEVTRYRGSAEMLMSYQLQDGTWQKYNERKLIWADSSFLKMLSFPSLIGNSETALSKPGSVVLTRPTAKRYFGEENPIGKNLVSRTAWGAGNSWTVTCVLEDIPLNSSMQFDFLLSSNKGSVTDPVFTTLIQLEDHIDPLLFAQSVNENLIGNTELMAKGKELKVILKSLSSMQLFPAQWLLLLIGIMTLGISWINFVNLSTSRFMERYKEVGIRKVLGSDRGKLIRQFIFESFSLNLLALLSSILIFVFSYPSIKDFVGGKMLPLLEFQTYVNTAFLAIFLLGSLLSSTYPALFLSSLSPIKALTARIIPGQKGAFFRHFLVITQFSIAIVLVIGVFVITGQLNYMKDQNLGINLDRVLIIKAPKDNGKGMKSRHTAFKTQVAQTPIIDAVTSSSTMPGESYRNEAYFSRANSKDKKMLHINAVASNFVEVFDATFVAGHNFIESQKWMNASSIILNEAAMKKLGFNKAEEALNASLTDLENEVEVKIIGIVKDYHKTSLKESIQPMAFRYNPRWGHVALKINTGNYSNSQDLKECIAFAEAIWEKVYPNQPFEYYFLDERFNQQYLSDVRFRKLFSIFSGLSIFLAILGLLGLTMFMVVKRKKEVGIRKTFGASVFQILTLYVKAFSFQILISMIIGVPIAYLLMRSWLSNYSYHMNIEVWTIIFPCLLVTTLSMVVIISETSRAAMANPIDSLRDE